jgi:hypothetical protein
MKMMTDLEISKALALAIGYNSTDVAFHEDMWAMVVHTGAHWREFDFQDWNVIGPIAAKFDLFPMVAACHADQWAIVTDKVQVYAETPQKAIALAVIEATK